MTQVSKRVIQQKVQDRIFTLFVASILKCNSKEIAVALIEDLLTPTERIMLSKRFSIAYMLLKGYDYDSISEILKVSRTTIGKVSYWLKEKGSGMRTIIQKIQRDDSIRHILEEIQDSVAELAFSAPGQSWSTLKTMLWASRRARKKVF